MRFAIENGRSVPSPFAWIPVDRPQCPVVIMKSDWPGRLVLTDRIEGQNKFRSILAPMTLFQCIVIANVQRSKHRPAIGIQLQHKAASHIIRRCAPSITSCQIRHGRPCKQEQAKRKRPQRYRGRGLDRRPAHKQENQGRRQREPEIPDCRSRDLHNHRIIDRGLVCGKASMERPSGGNGATKRDRIRPPGRLKKTRRRNELRQDMYLPISGAPQGINGRFGQTNFRSPGTPSKWGVARSH
jgi:hypothetical protein